MRVAIYTPASGIPPEAEAIADEYDPEQDTILYRNASAWRGETERAGIVYTHRDDIREAYESGGAEVKALFNQTTPVPEEKREEGKDFYLRHKSGQWYDVVSAEGEPANDKGLTKEDAIELRDRLNAGDVTSG